MARVTWSLIATAVALAASGCASYASARLESAEAQERAPEIFGEVARLEFGKRVQVALPAHLVVSDVIGGSSRRNPDVQDRRTVQLVDVLGKDAETYSWVEPLDISTDGRDSAGLTAARLRDAASRHHADLMLVTSMGERVEERYNPLGILKLLVLPCFLVPTETTDVRLSVKSAVVDVRNNLVYATFEDFREDRVHASAYAERDAVTESFDKLYADSLEKMRERVASRLRTLERGTD
jgi:hypothetical protein